ncbi:eIF-2-alpha kinase activator GCN1-like [Homalodisca vitripennis]|uniref:eIF-2-alpha kinase activator GCN1-like n=1 Tax=Homalodisca vitripennis TaxID=197043 RepID=UPI001EEA033E|nr:eIF-2-alpha kinase activator GCN1-like [Homalodisca vitripennis]
MVVAEKATRRTVALLHRSLLQVLNKPEDPLVTLGLQIISEHAQTRGVGGMLDLYHPRLLPRRLMFDLLIDLINHTTARVQQQAVATLLDVAASGSGGPGCARASVEEIDCLLGALPEPLPGRTRQRLEGAHSNGTSSTQTVREPGTLLEAHQEGYGWPSSMSPKKIGWFFTPHVCTCRELADKLWQQARLQYDDTQTQCATEAGAQALATLLKQSGPHLTDVVLKKLLNIYHEKTGASACQAGQSRPCDRAADRHVGATQRCGTGPGTVGSPAVPTSRLGTATFFVSTGLGTRAARCARTMLAAALAAVDLHGKETVNSLLPVFEDFLDRAPDSGSFDAVRQSVVILMGCLARHLDRDDRKIKPIVGETHRRALYTFTAGPGGLWPTGPARHCVPSPRPPFARHHSPL